MTHFAVRALKGNELAVAWPIVRSSNVYANLDWWVTDAAELIAAGGGVLVALAQDGAIHGVATFRRPDNRGTDKALTIPMLVTFELSGSGPARSALGKELERIATKLECAHVIFPVAGNLGAVRRQRFLAAAG